MNQLEHPPLESHGQIRERLKEYLLEQFDDFNSTDKYGTNELLKKMRIRNFGQEKLGEAINQLDDDFRKNADYWGTNNDNRIEMLNLLSRQSNGQVGENLAIDDVIKILAE